MNFAYFFIDIYSFFFYNQISIIIKFLFISFVYLKTFILLIQICFFKILSFSLTFKTSELIPKISSQFFDLW